jgi:hypothetical protein
MNSSILSCHCAANLKYTTLNFSVPALQSKAQLDTKTQMETHNWIHTIGHTDLDTLLDKHSYEIPISL